MIRVAQKGAVETNEARALVDALVEKRYPLIEDVDGRVYYHIKGKSAVDAALLALAYRYPKRMSKDELVATLDETDSKRGMPKLPYRELQSW